jgi:hypothetical protein
MKHNSTEQNGAIITKEIKKTTTNKHGLLSYVIHRKGGIK